jgi:hypothetical protein
MVLVIVLVVIVALSLGAYTFSDLMLAQRHAVKVHGQRLQTRFFVESGVEVVKAYLAYDETTRAEMGGLFDNPLMFQGQVVLPDADPQARGGFAVLSPYVDESGAGAGVRYGLEDESTRLNLNVILLVDKKQPGAGRTLLMGLPNMTEDVADAILDWMDDDDEPREYGAEVEYYSALDPPYAPKNGPLDTIEELLLVRGVTPQLLLGTDANRNGMTDPHEMNVAALGGASLGGTSAYSTSTADGTDPMLAGTTPGMVERGWSSYLTLYSAERNVNSLGQPRIYLNGTDLQTLSDQLSQVFDPEWVNFILAYRLYGPDTDTSAEGQTKEAASVQLDLSQQPKGTFKQVLDLIGAQVRIAQSSGSGGNSPGQSGQNQSGQDQNNQTQATILRSPFANDPVSMLTYLPTLMDNCSIVEGTVIPPRININQAPLELLLGIPGMTEEIADQIVASRSMGMDETTTDRANETWLLSEGIVTLDQMRALLPFVCAGGDVYRAQIVGYFQGGGPSSRAEIIFDATGSQPRVLFWRDISHLGRGYPLETLGVDLMQGM